MNLRRSLHRSALGGLTLLTAALGYQIAVVASHA